jgi:Arc/MetJ-type ribon-helix-helix transcriptional regulator
MMPSPLENYSLRLSPKLVEIIDILVRRGYYHTRSEAMKSLMIAGLVARLSQEMREHG